MSKLFRDPDRTHDDSFDLDELDLEGRDLRRGGPRPGKRSRAQSLEEVLEIVSSRSLPVRERERIAAEYLLQRRAAGRSVDTAVARDYGERLGMDLADVRVHDDSETASIARALGKTAFTFGREIFFASGAYQPTSRRGRFVLAHEMAHIAQHRGQGPQPGAPLTIGREGDRHEREADRAASRLVAGRRARVGAASPGVRFMGPEDVTAVGEAADEAAPPPGTSEEELEEVMRAIREGDPGRLLDGCTDERQREVIRYCIGRSDMAQDEKNRLLLRSAENPSPDQTIEVHGVNEAVNAAENAMEGTGREERSPLTQQPDEVPDVQSASAGTQARTGVEAEGAAGTVDNQVADELPASDQSLIARELASHETWMAAEHGTAVGVESFVTDPANLEDAGVDGASEILERIGQFTRVGQAMVGARELYQLIGRDWEQTWERLSAWGEGSTEYERLASSVGVVTEAVDVGLSVVNTVAGGLSAADGSKWLANVMSADAARPVAGALSAVATGVSSGAGVLSMIRGSILTPVEETFRALHRFQKQADPSAAEEASTVLEQGATGLMDIVGDFSTTPDASGPDDASGAARAGNTQTAVTATASELDLPLVDVNVQGYESQEGSAAAQPEADGAGLANRDRNRDPEHQPDDAPPIAATEAAGDQMSGPGRPSATPEPEVGQENSSHTQEQEAGASSMEMEDSEYGAEPDAGQPQMRSSQSERSQVALEQLDVSAPASTRPEQTQEQSEPMQELESFTGSSLEAGPPPAEIAAPQTAGRDNPPTTLAFLNRLYGTMNFLTQARGRASSTTTDELRPDHERLVEYSNQLDRDIEARRERHAEQRTRLEAAETSVAQFKAESTQMDNAVSTMERIADVGNLVGNMPGRLGSVMSNIGGRIEQTGGTWSMVCEQMAGQEQEIAALRARQVTEQNRLEAARDRANRARDDIQQAGAALQSAQTAEAGAPSAELGAIDRTIEEKRQLYDRLSRELRQWAQRSSGQHG